RDPGGRAAQRLRRGGAALGRAVLLPACDAGAVGAVPAAVGAPPGRRRGGPRRRAPPALPAPGRVPRAGADPLLHRELRLRLVRRLEPEIHGRAGGGAPGPALPGGPVAGPLVRERRVPRAAGWAGRARPPGRADRARCRRPADPAAARGGGVDPRPVRRGVETAGPGGRRRRRRERPPTLREPRRRRGGRVSELQPWQWDESTWRGHVERVRAGRPLRPRSWPGGAQVAVALSFDSRHATPALRDGEVLPGKLSQGEYGARVGVPRILRLLERFAAPSTFFVPAVSALLHDGELKSYVDAGHEVALHGWI